MKRYLITFLVIIAISISAYSQAQKVDELNIPSSPAFVLLDESPANIEKPSNPKAVAFSLINLWEGNGAVEFTPYWLYDHQTYTFNNDVRNKVPFWQTFAISAATTKKGDTTNLSAGFRVQVFRQYADEAAILADRAAIAAQLVLPVPDEVKINKLVETLNQKRTKIKWNIELAGAYSGLGTSEQKLTGNKAGIWLNIRHTPKDFPIDLVALFRYSKTFTTDNTIPDSSFIDYGMSLSKQGDEFDLQFEYVNRRDVTLHQSYDRLAFIVNYRISKGIIAVASFGKNFDEVENVFTAFGVKIGLSRQPIN